MSDTDDLTYDGVVEDISSGADAAQKITKGFFPKTFGLFDETLYLWLKPKLTKKQSEIIETHISEASQGNKILIDERSVKISDAAALIEWADGVKDIDPKLLPETSERWQEAFKELLKGSKDMLNAIQKIKPSTIENFSTTGSFTLDDAIEFEKLGLGSIMKPKRIALPRTSSQYFTFMSICMLIFSTAFIVPVVFLAPVLRGIGLDENLALLISIPLILLWINALRRYEEFQHDSWLFRRTFNPQQDFWISHLGGYTLTKALGSNPNKSVFWQISPVEEDRSMEHIKNTPNINRDFGN